MFKLGKPVNGMLNDRLPDFPLKSMDEMIAEIESKIIKNQCCEYERWERERNEARLEDFEIINKYCKGDNNAEVN